MSDGELVERLEKGEMQTNPEFYAEFIKRMEEKGILYMYIHELDVAVHKFMSLFTN